MASELALEPVVDFESVRPEWARLAQPSEDVFQTPEWALTWWRHFGAGKTLRLFACRGAEGELVAVLPLYETRMRQRRVVRFVGSGHSDRLAPVCAPEDRARAAAALRRALDDLPGWDLFIGDCMPEAGGWPALLDATVLRRHESPVIRTNGDGWDAYMATRTSKFRNDVRRRVRRASREHRLEFRSVELNDLDAGLETLFELHRARWASEPDRATSGFGPDAAFHRDFAHVAAEHGWLRLWIMELDGRPVAAWLGFRIGSTVAHYQSGRDPEFNTIGAGKMLFAHTLRDALDGGAVEYRTLRGGEPYKRDFADDDDPVATVAIARSVVGRVYLAALEGADRLPSGGRRALKALAGGRGISSL